MYGNRSTIALTCEIYGNDSAWQYEPGPEPGTWWEKGVFQVFNPTPDQIEVVIERWLPVFSYITERGIRDAYNIAATNITFSKSIVCQNYTMKVYVTVSNQCEFPETTDITIYANATALGTQTVNLTEMQPTRTTFVWNTAGFARGNYTISAVASGIQAETNLADNRFDGGILIVTRIGDINADGKVDVKDVYKVAKAFGTRGPDYDEPGSPPSPGWNSTCDLNDDNKVDVKDYYATCKHYGETDP